MIYKFGDPDGVSKEDFDNAYISSRSDSQKRNSPLAIHGDSNDIKLVRHLADEVINTSGAEVKVFIRTDNADYDTIWDEDPDPTYWTPMQIKGFFKPKPIETELKRWGVDTINKTDISFSHREIFENLGERMIRVGDVIQLPYNAASINPKNYRVTNASPSGVFRYTWLYFTCQLELLTADITVRPDQDIQDDDPNLGRYRESI